MTPKRKMWTWILLSPVALILLAYLIGCFCPETYTAHGRLRMTISAEELFARLTDPVAYPMSGSMCREVEVLPSEEGRGVWIEDLKQSKLRIADLELSPPRQLRRRVEDTVVPFSAEVEFMISPEVEGCTLTCRNVSRVAWGTWHVPLFRLSIALFGGVKAGCCDYLRRLAGGQGQVEWLEES